MNPAEVKQQVRQHYAAAVATGNCCTSEGCCAGAAADPCCDSSPVSLEGFAGPSLGCGSPLTYAAVQPGETVVDLGAGAGGEVILAAQQAGPGGRGVGVDMTPEMVSKARANAERLQVGNAEFYLGEIEHLPLPAASADVVVSNCVINLVPDKARTFREAYRVLKPGGRLVVSDMVSNGPLPEAVRRDPAAWAACIAGAVDVDEYRATIAGAGFEDVETVASTTAVPGKVFSVTIRARKPA